MKRTTLVMTLVMTLLVSMMGTAFAYPDGLPSEQANELDSDTLTVEVDEFACPTEGLPDGVNGVATNPLDQEVYIIPWPFSLDDHSGVEKVEWTTFGYTWQESDITPAQGFDGNWYPPYPSEHLQHEIIFTFKDGTTYTGTADFNTDGCITRAGWADVEAVPDVDISFVKVDPLNVTTGEDFRFDVSLTNSGAAVANATVGVEVTRGTDIERGDLTLEYRAPGDEDWLPLTFNYDDSGVLYLYFGPDGGFPLDHDYDETTEFRANFNVAGTFTGSVYAIDLSA